MLERSEAALFVELADEHGDRRRLLTEQCEQWRNERCQAARRRQPDRGCALAADALAKPRPCPLELARHDGGVCEEDLALGRQVHEPRPARAADQLDPDGAL